MGYGVLALLPLGDQYVPVGILAGLYSAIFIPLSITLLTNLSRELSRRLRKANAMISQLEG